MRLIVASAHAQAAYAPLMAAGHRVVSMVRNVPALRAQIELEQPDGVLIQGLLSYDAAELTQVLQSLTVPTVLVLDSDDVTPALQRVAPVLPADTPWAEAAATLASAAARSPISSASQSESDPEASASPVEPAAVRDKVDAPANRKETARLLLYPVVGGAGATTLTLSLAAAAAQAGLKSLAASVDQLALLARLGIADEGRVQRISGCFHATTVLGSWDLPTDFELVIWEIDVGYLKAAVLAQAPVAILTRPTGEGRLNAVRAVHALRRRDADVHSVIVARRGSMKPEEFTRHCRGDDPAFPPVESLPEDAQVPALEDVAGHALDAPLYGPAVEKLARVLFSALPWPIDEDEEAKIPGRIRAASGKPRRWPIQIELTE
jgi:hypothetical protein